MPPKPGESPQDKAPRKPEPKPAKATKPKQPGERSTSTRLSSYAAEAARLLGGSGSARRKQGKDPVAEDAEVRESRPLRKGQSKPKD
jgi:hypothetical protein